MLLGTVDVLFFFVLCNGGKRVLCDVWGRDLVKLMWSSGGSAPSRLAISSRKASWRNKEILRSTSKSEKEARPPPLLPTSSYRVQSWGVQSNERKQTPKICETTVRADLKEWRGKRRFLCCRCGAVYPWVQLGSSTANMTGLRRWYERFSSCYGVFICTVPMDLLTIFVIHFACWRYDENTCFPRIVLVSEGWHNLHLDTQERISCTNDDPIAQFYAEWEAVPFAQNYTYTVL